MRARQSFGGDRAADDFHPLGCAGTLLCNTGSWVYQPHFLTPETNGSPYWPGTAVAIEDEQPPRLVRLLGDRGHDILRPPC